MSRHYWHLALLAALLQLFLAACGPVVTAVSTPVQAEPAVVVVSPTPNPCASARIVAPKQGQQVKQHFAVSWDKPDCLMIVHAYQEGKGDPVVNTQGPVQ